MLNVKLCLCFCPAAWCDPDLTDPPGPVWTAPAPLCNATRSLVDNFTTNRGHRPPFLLFIHKFFVTVARHRAALLIMRPWVLFGTFDFWVILCVIRMYSYYLVSHNSQCHNSQSPAAGAVTSLGSGDILTADHFVFCSRTFSARSETHKICYWYSKISY